MPTKPHRTTLKEHPPKTALIEDATNIPKDSINKSLYNPPPRLTHSSQSSLHYRYLHPDIPTLFFSISRNMKFIFILFVTTALSAPLLSPRQEPPPRCRDRANYLLCMETCLIPNTVECPDRCCEFYLEFFLSLSFRRLIFFSFLALILCSGLVGPLEAGGSEGRTG